MYSESIDPIPNTEYHYRNRDSFVNPAYERWICRTTPALSVFIMEITPSQDALYAVLIEGGYFSR